MQLCNTNENFIISIALTVNQIRNGLSSSDEKIEYGVKPSCSLKCSVLFDTVLVN